MDRSGDGGNRLLRHFQQRPHTIAALIPIISCAVGVASASAPGSSSSTIVAAAPAHVDAGDVLRRREAGGEDDRVDLPQPAVDGRDSGGGDALDALGHQLQVLAVEGGVVVVREQRPLCAEGVLRPQLLAQLRILYRLPVLVALALEVGDRVRMSGNLGRNGTKRLNLDRDSLVIL